MSHQFAIVHRTYDPIQAELLGDLMRDAGISAQIIGTRSGAMIGAGQVIMQMYIQVPQREAAQAIDFLEAYFEQDGEDLLRQEGLLDDDDDDDNDAANAAEAAAPGVPKPLSPLLAAGSMLLIIGGGHWYARRGFTTLVIAAGQILALINIFTGTWESYIMGLTMLGLLLVFDVVGSQLAVRSYNRGHRAPRLTQLLVGVAFVAAAGSIGSFVGPRVNEPKQKPKVALTAPAAPTAPHIANAALLG